MITGTKYQPAADEVSLIVRGIVSYSNLVVPDDFFDNWHWIIAVDAFDYGDPEPLASLLAEFDEYPANVRVLLSDIVQGKREPNRKAFPKVIKAKDRMPAALSALSGLSLRDHIDINSVFFGERDGVEAIAIRKSNDDSYSKKKKPAIAKTYGISVDTLDNLRRELKSKIKKWPTL